MPESTAAAKKQVIDFTNVKDSSGINPKHRTPGDYKFKITKVTEGESSNKNSMWTFLLVPTDMQSASYPYRCVLTPDSLWKVRNLLIAAGINVPKKRVAVDPNKIVGREIGGTLDDEEYEGKLKSVVTAVFPASDVDDGDVPASDGSDEVEEEETAEPEVSEEDMEELDVEDL